MLRELMERQSDVKEIISSARNTEDKTIEDGITGNLGYPDDLIVAVVLALKEMELEDEETEISQTDVIFAGMFLDHLDTLGFQLDRKPIYFEDDDGSDNE